MCSKNLKKHWLWTMEVLRKLIRHCKSDLMPVYHSGQLRYCIEVHCGCCDNIKLIVTYGQSIFFTYVNSSFPHWMNIDSRRYLLKGDLPLQWLFQTTNEVPKWTDRRHLSGIVLIFTLSELNTNDFAACQHAAVSLSPYGSEHAHKLLSVSD